MPQENQPTTFRNSVFGLLLILCIAIAGAMIAANRLLGAGPLPAPATVWVKPGTMGWALASQLYQEGVIADPYSFTIALRAQSNGRDIHSGEYRFNAYQPLQSVIMELRRGEAIVRQLTIPEGLTSAEIAVLINGDPYLDGPPVAVAPEGSLLPETYNFSRGDGRAAMVTRMQAAQQKALDSLWATRAADLPLKTPQEAVIMASIVERETGVPAERARVAGVYLNRLRQNMALQADPTVIYGLTNGAGPLGRPLLSGDLAKPSPYNTYLQPGLPPTPIANPGRAALQATLQPEHNDYLYFVASPSGTGHNFAATLAEHDRNVALWRKFEATTTAKEKAK